MPLLYFLAILKLGLIDSLFVMSDALVFLRSLALKDDETLVWLFPVST